MPVNGGRVSLPVDVRAVFPSMSQQWLREVLRRFGLPPRLPQCAGSTARGIGRALNVGSQR
eukprot:7183018-Pyramimonas_sp.AAC.1